MNFVMLIKLFWDTNAQKYSGIFNITIRLTCRLSDFWELLAFDSVNIWRGLNFIWMVERRAGSAAAGRHSWVAREIWEMGEIVADGDTGYRSEHSQPQQPQPVPHRRYQTTPQLPTSPDIPEHLQLLYRIIAPNHTRHCNNSNFYKAR